LSVLKGVEVQVQHSRDGRKYIDQILAQHRGAPLVAVGIQGARASAAHGEGLTTADVAAINEFGMGVPERPFMRLTFEQRAGDLQKLGRGLEHRVLEQTMTVDAALNVMGAAAVGYVRGTIDSGVPPPNAPSTIARKGSSKPLINFGQLKGSITSEVRRGR
jgi:hypothetical protein